MTITEAPDKNMLRVAIEGKLEEQDIRSIAHEVESMLKNYAHLKVLVDARAFEGWSNLETIKEHFAFVRDHHKNVDAIAFIAGHAWQSWIAKIASVFVDTEVKVFDKTQATEAENWLQRKKAA